MIDDEQDNPDTLIRFLEFYTTGVRSMVRPEHRRRLFIFWSLKSRAGGNEPGPDAFEGAATGTGSEDSRFTYAWNTWCKSAKFGSLLFSSLRPTCLNLAHRAFSGDVLAVAALGSHSSVNVFEHHYKSAHSRARNDRKLAKVMMLRDRLLASGGQG
jgi:integrase